MKEKKLFIDALETLLHSWGGDTPQEAVWGVNELLDWYQMEYGIYIDRLDPEDFSSEELRNQINNFGGEDGD